MACGDRYKHLLVITSGETADYPWGDGWVDAATPYKYELWKNKASEIALMVNTHWRALERVENERNTNAKRLELVEAQNGLVDQVKALPSLWETLADGSIAWNWEPYIQQAVAAARAGTCVLEQVDDAIASYSVAPPKVPAGDAPKVDEPPLPGLGGGGKSGKFDGALLLALALGGVGIWLWTKKGGE